MMTSLRSLRALNSIALVSALLSLGSTANAESEPRAGSEAEASEAEEVAEAEQAQGGLRLQSSLRVRGIPVGLSLFNDGAWRIPLFDSANMLLKNTYVDAGLTTGLSPAYVWAGGYVSALPVQVLALRFSVQYTGYFGNFGYLYTPEDADGLPWSLEDIERSADDEAGESAGGLLIEAQATPRVKVGDFVVTAETTWTQLDMDVDQPYYEPYFDLLLDPKDSFLITKPTVGWVFTMPSLDSWLLAGFRWERTRVFGQDYKRDLAAALALWKLPGAWLSWGEPKVALVGGWWVNHPNREDTPWFGGQLTFEFGASGSQADD